MKVSEILGKKILDKKVYEIGKIAEITFDKKTFDITHIYGSTGNPISKKYYQFEPNAILALGDYLQVDVDKNEINEYAIEKIPSNDADSIKVNEIIGKKVLDCNGNDSGKITSIEVDFEKHVICDITMAKQASSFGKNLEAKVTQDDIMGLGDYLLLKNEVEFEKEDEKEKEEEDKKEDEEEKVKVDIN